MKKLLLLEQDVGLFCLIGQVINMIQIIESNKLDIVPIGLFGKRCMYFHDEGWMGKRNVWEYYFEPLNTGYDEDYMFNFIGDDLMDVAESLCKYSEYQRGVEHGWVDQLSISITQDDLENCDRFREFLYCDDHDTFQGHKASYDFADRSHSFGKLKLRPYVKEKSKKFLKENFQDQFMIGVHVRGTDSYGGVGRTGREVDIAGYFGAIRDAMSRHDPVKIFVASDEERYVNLFRNEFEDKVVVYPAYRTAEDDPHLFGRGPTGQSLPGYISTSRRIAVQNGEDALVEYLLLCQSDLLLHNNSGLPKMVRIARHPHLKSIGFGSC